MYKSVYNHLLNTALSTVMVCSFISASGVGDLVKGDVGDLGKTKQHYES